MSHQKLPALFVGVLIVTLLASCAGGAAPGPTSTPTIDPATPAAATAAAWAAITEAAATSAAATGFAQSTAEAQSTLDAQATLDAQSTAGAIAQMTATQDAKNVKATEDMAAKQTRTAEAIAQKTAQAQPMAELAQQLVADGYLESAEGSYKLLADFDQAVAMINYIIQFPTGIDTRNFILRTDLAWESASDKANWNASACGFIFHVGEDGSYYSASLALDGNVHITEHKPNYTWVDEIANGRYGKVDIPQGSVKFVLVVDLNQITVFINDKMVKSYKTNLKYTSGELSYSITSGTNKDFGTRCRLTNVDLWDLK